jgi:hypothetical protein
MIETLLAITKADRLNFISPAGLGDTMTCCGLKESLEAGYGAKIHFIIKPAHTVVMKMYAEADYSEYTFSESELWGIGRNNDTPQIGQMYVAHPIYSDASGLMRQWREGKLTCEQLFRQFFKLEGRPPVKAKVPVWYPEADAAMKKADGFPPAPEKTALLLPEARSVPALGQAFWVRLAERLVREGYAVMQNCRNRHFAIPDIPTLPDDLETALASALSCVRVYSLRSGICDLIKGKAALTVFYPDELSYNRYLIECPDVENILVENGKPAKAAIKQNIKNILKKLFLLDRVSARFNAASRRIDELEDALLREYSPGLIYNDLIKLGRTL